MGIGGIETGVRDISKYLNKKNIDNYILCESSNKNFNVKGLKIIKLDNLKFKNVFLLPHLGSATEETREAMGMRVFSNISDFFEGKEPTDRVV